MKKRSYLQTRDTNNEFLISQMAAIYKFPKYSATNAIIAIPSFGGGIYGDITNNIIFIFVQMCHTTIPVQLQLPIALHQLLHLTQYLLIHLQ